MSSQAATTASDLASVKAYLRAEGLTKRFGAFTALADVSFAADRGEFLSILGPSGCGKTTLLRLVAGLEIQDEGRVLVEERDVSLLPVSRRKVGIVFQSYALFPNLTAEENVGYGLRNGRGASRRREDVARRVGELLALVGLPGVARKYPAQLSGGQQQRVALARAMALSPDLLLLDEPLSALDAKVRVHLRDEIRQLQRRLGVTTIMVTHDQEEALTMADRILVMDHGRLVQAGTPRDIYDRPATPFVASFIGAMNFLPLARREGEGAYRSGAALLRTGDRGGNVEAVPQGGEVTLAIRPEDIALLATDAAGEAAAARDGAVPEGNVLEARLEHLEYRGSLYRLQLVAPALAGDDAAAPARLHVDVPAPRWREVRLGETGTLRLALPADRLHVYAGKAMAGKA